MLHRALALALGWTCALAAWGQGVTIVKNGRSDYVIVRPAKSSPSQVYAAEELQSFVEQMTGAKLPIATDAAPLPARAILLGWTRHSARVAGEPVDLAALGDDGFSIRVRPPFVLIAAGPVRGTLYGVYELLEKYGGCRWYASYFSVIPKRRTWTLPVVTDTQTPAFASREPFWWDMFDGDFAARCKANGSHMRLTEKHGGKIRFGAGLFVHTFYRLMPPGEFFKDHPEYYSEVRGRRTCERAQLCLSNPEVTRLLTGRVLARIRSDPTAKLFSVSQNDCGGYCTCPACRAADALEGAHAGSLIPFVNQVAAAVEKEFPNVWIETLAYHYTRTPPRYARPRSNVVPRLCTIECDFSQPLNKSPYSQNVKFVRDIQGWSAMTDKLFIWDYTTNFRHYLGPHPNFAALQGNVRFFRDNRVVAVFEQGAYQGPHAEFAELRAWVLAKLLWNPDLNLNALYDDFFNGFYGPAAPLVRRYFDELQALTRPDDCVLRCFASVKAKWYTDAFFDRALALWREAEQRVADQPRYLYNVRMSAMPVLYAKLMRWPAMNVRYRLVGGVLKPEGVDPEYAKLAQDLLNRLDEAAKRRGHAVRICESYAAHRQRLARWRASTEGFRPIRLTRGPWSAGVAPELSGRVVELRRSEGPNFINPDSFAPDFTLGSPNLRPSRAALYSVRRRKADAAQLVYSVRGRYRIVRDIRLADDGLHTVSTLQSLRMETQNLRPVLQVVADLGDVSGLFARCGAGPWRALTVPEDQVLAMHTLLDAKPGGELLLASGATRRGLAVRLPDAAFARVMLICDTRRNAARLMILCPRQPLPGRASRSWRLDLRPVDAVPDVPPARPAGAHRPDRLVLEEVMLRLARPGVWGEIVADPQADDGFAVKLFNTHYEWCLQWPVAPSLFEPGAKYRVRMRIRVEKGGREGEAFWAGVYDSVRRKGWGSIAVKTSQVKPGYQWYNVATWTPEAGQYIWTGPGRFDKKGGGRSAVRAVYVDKYEVVRVK